MSFLPATVPNLSFTAHSAATRGHCNISPHFDSAEPRMHCEEQHNIGETLPEYPLNLCFCSILISQFYFGACACWLNVVLVFLRNIFYI